MNVKVLIAYNNPSILFKNDFLIPIHCGRSLVDDLSSDNYQWMKNNTIGDNTGDNISLLNKQYNELTCVYWAWKNFNALGNPDYIGLNHYRRLFCFNNSLNLNNNKWEIDINFPIENIEQFLKYIQFDNISIVKELTNCDGIVSFVNTPGLTVYNQYINSDYHFASDLAICKNIIDEKYTMFSKYWDMYMRGETQFFGNIFILKKNIFFDYCSFIFPILDECIKHINYKYRSNYEKRLFISERLTGCFIYKILKDNINIKKRHIVKIDNVKVHKDIYHNGDEIPIVFAVSNNYFKYVIVTAASIYKNSNAKNRLHLYLLYKSNKKNDLLLKRTLLELENIGFSKIDFIDVTNYLNKIKEKDLYIQIHVDVSTYFRFFIPFIFKNFNKILYLDCDLIVEKPIENLYNISLNNKMIGAVRDIREIIAGKLELMVSGINWKTYVTKCLKLDSYFKYFQAGVLLINPSLMYKNNIFEKLMLELKRIKTPILSDQDILNAVFCNNIEYLPQEWNVEWQIPFEFKDYEKIIPSELDIYQKVLDNPAILHYASSIKPWDYPSKQNSWRWWKYARDTYFYEEFILSIKHESRFIHIKRYNIEKVKMILKKILNYIFPYNTKRRNIAYKIKNIINRYKSTSCGY